MTSVRRIAVRLLIVPALLLVIWSWHDAKLPVTDFSSYWVAGHSLLERHNPYDAAQALRMERSLGLTRERPFVMRNPPWTLWLVAPLGMLDYTTAFLLWTCALIVALLISQRLLARSDFESPTRNPHVGRTIAATFLFAPTLIALSVGQTGPLVLLGIAGFLYLHERNEWWAGASLVLAAAKPHIALLFWVVLLMWIIERRRWRVLVGGIAAGTVATALAMIFDPHVFTHYVAMLRAETIEQQFMPTIAGWLRSRFGLSWLQLAPACIGLIGAVIYYARNHRDWNWHHRMPILLLASIIVAPYAFLFDEVILLAALLPIAKEARLSLVSEFVIINAVIFAAIASGVRVVSPWYLWTPWAWTALYSFAKVQSSGRATHVSVIAQGK